MLHILSNSLSENSNMGKQLRNKLIYMLGVILEQNLFTF